MDGQWLAVLPWQRYLAQHLASKYLPSWLIFHHANFGHLEVRSFQITFTNTCVLENCVRTPFNESVRIPERIGLIEQLQQFFCSNFCSNICSNCTHEKKNRHYTWFSSLFSSFFISVNYHPFFSFQKSQLTFLHLQGGHRFTPCSQKKKKSINGSMEVTLGYRRIACVASVSSERKAIFRFLAFLRSPYCLVSLAAVFSIVFSIVSRCVTRQRTAARETTYCSQANRRINSGRAGISI